MNPARPFLSVLLPVKNAGRFLRSAVRDVLMQEGVELELIAVDDGSTDGTGERLAEFARGDPRVVVIPTPGGGPAHALELARSRARAPLLAQMEADDRCPPHRLRLLADALADHPEWDAAVSRASLFGARTAGMARYLQWQNRVGTPDELARARFLEIPALHQTGLYRRGALERAGGFAGDPRWPLDIDFWMRWFAEGLCVGKVPRQLYRWRQHAAQATRTSPLHRLPVLRRCKVHYFLRGPGRARPLDLFSVGETLEEWRRELIAAGATDVRAIAWKPGTEFPRARPEALRLFVYGMEPARARVRAAVRDFDPQRDWFAA